MSFFGELRRLNPRAPVVHLVRLESEGRVWVEHRARAGHLAHDVVCRPEFAVANPFEHVAIHRTTVAARAAIITELCTTFPVLRSISNKDAWQKFNSLFASVFER